MYVGNVPQLKHAMNIANREVDAKALSTALRQSKLFKDKTHTGFVFLDIDETVFTRMNQVLDPSLAETLEDITALGHHIVWITARPCQSRQQTIKDLANLMGRHTAKGVTCKGRSGEANNSSLTCTCTQQHRLKDRSKCRAVAIASPDPNDGLDR